MTDPVIRGRVDRSGHLVAADAALLRLQQRAGGSLAKPLALPQLARLVSLAQRLQREISRPMLAADDHSDVTAWVRMVPEADGVLLEISDWRTKPISPPRAELLSGQNDGGVVAVPGSWMWECDGSLRLVSLQAADGAAPVPSRWEGRSLSELFELQPDEAGRFPVLQALASQSRFQRQLVRTGAANGQTDRQMALSADPLLDATGGFLGFKGLAVPHPDAAAGAPATDPLPPVDPAFGSLPLSDPQFGRRIDGALRGPLSRIIATAETIAGQFDGPIRADYARYAGDIAHAGRHLLGLVDDLADLQNIERPGFKAAREAVDLADIARRAVGLLMMKAEEKAIRIDIPPVGDTMPATGEFRRALQILLNLLGNAIRYSPEGSVIAIGIDRHDDRATVTIADQGQGLSTEQQAVIFEKFERLGRTDSGGSGLGLYIARRLARAMDGDLTIDSAPGQGARFTLSLPARD